LKKFDTVMQLGPLNPVNR